MKSGAGKRVFPSGTRLNESSFKEAFYIGFDSVSKKLDRKLKLALDETRLLLLGGQVLLGFQFQAVFQDAFTSLSSAAANTILAGVALMIVSIALMIAPAMHHRLVEQGNSSERLLKLTSVCAGTSLIPLSISLSLATGVIFGSRFGSAVGTVLGLFMGAMCVFCWLGLEIFVGLSHRLSFGGDDSEAFLRLASVFVIVAPLFLSLGISAELFVVFDKVTDSLSTSLFAGGIAWMTMMALWYVIPIAINRIASDSHEFQQPGAEADAAVRRRVR